MCLSGMIVGVYVWASRHINQRDKHPCATDLVYRDVCEQVQKAASSERARNREEITEAHHLMTERFGELKTDMKEGFKEVKELIRNTG